MLRPSTLIATLPSYTSSPPPSISKASAHSTLALASETTIAAIRGIPLVLLTAVPSRVPLQFKPWETRIILQFAAAMRLRLHSDSEEAGEVIGLETLCAVPGLRGHGPAADAVLRKQVEWVLTTLTRLPRHSTPVSHHGTVGTAN
jgi:hypothetical protein